MMQTTDAQPSFPDGNYMTYDDYYTSQTTGTVPQKQQPNMLSRPVAPQRPVNPVWGGFPLLPTRPPLVDLQLAMGKD